MRSVEWWPPRIAVVLVLAADAALCGSAAASPRSGLAPVTTATSTAATTRTATTSHYLVLADDPRGGDQIGYRTGCADGRAGVPGLRVLFFGTQETGGRIRPPGTTTASPVARVDEATVERAALGWIRGFTECGSATAVVALAANNKSDGGVDGAQAGSAWASLVQRVAATSSDRVTVAGGLDGEPAWSGPRWARAWVDSYVAESSRALYLAGSADGCPDGDVGDRCLGGWSVDDVFHMATGAGRSVFALPQIYRTDGIQARQWAGISRHERSAGRGPLRFAGVLTQQQACRQKPGCSRTDNSPAAARAQLAAALGTEPDGATTASLTSTDVAWSGDKIDLAR